MERKLFLKQCGTYCLGSLLGAGLLASCSGYYYATATISDNALVVNKNEFKEVKNGNTAYRKFVLVRTDKLNFPICIYRLDDSNYSALLMECTHKGCELTPQGDYLVCPCHGSEFNNTGKVQNPPAELDLHQYKITFNEENIYVHLT